MKCSYFSLVSDITFRIYTGIFVFVAKRAIAHTIWFFFEVLYVNIELAIDLLVVVLEKI